MAVDDVLTAVLIVTVLLLEIAAGRRIHATAGTVRREWRDVARQRRALAAERAGSTGQRGE